MIAVTELRRTQINVVKSKGILKAPSAAAIRQLTTDHSLGKKVKEHNRTGKGREAKRRERLLKDTNFIKRNKKN